jgi:phage terminase large subunit-like protein
MELDLQQLKAEKARRSFYFFFKEFWDTISTEPLVDNWHIKYLCDELQAMGLRIKARLPKEHDLIINVPPASTKSTIASVMFPAWLWAIDPTLRIISGSHGQSLSLSLAVKSRDIITSEKFKAFFPEIELKDDNNNKSNYSNSVNGQRITTSVGSGIIGQHAHVHIVDDPLNLDPSPVEIDAANNWIDSLSTRKIDKEVTPLILIMQRLADNDTTAYILNKNKRVKHICLPAVVSSNIKPEYLAENYENGMFDNARLPAHIIAQVRVDLGLYKYESQFLQNPSPMEGGIVKKAWIVKQNSQDPLFQEALKHGEIDFFVDTALTENKKNDPSGVLGTVFHRDRLFVFVSSQVWMEFGALVTHIDSLGTKYGKANSRIYIEPKANGHTVVQYMQKNSLLNVVLDTAPDKSKDIRLTAVSPFIESGKVIFIEGAGNEDLDELVMQITSQKPSNYGVRDCLVMAIKNKLMQRKNGKYNVRIK